MTFDWLLVSSTSFWLVDDCTIFPIFRFQNFPATEGDLNHESNWSHRGGTGVHGLFAHRLRHAFVRQHMYTPFDAFCNYPNNELQAEDEMITIIPHMHLPKLSFIRVRFYVQAHYGLET